MDYTLKNFRNTVFLFLILFFAFNFSQKTDAKAPDFPKQSKADTLLSDSLKAKPSDTIQYSAKYIQYDVANKMLYLNGKAKLDYQNISLIADTIRYNITTNMLDAIGFPILKEGTDEIQSEFMSYNVKSRWGKAHYGTTQLEKGLYNGRFIRKTNEEVLLVLDGDYSSCNLLDSTHYYFYGKNMKIITKDKVVARPVVMNIADVPVATLPYFVFPVKTGRKSGMLMPKWGGTENGDAGRGTRYIDNLGYYLAPNDFMDFMAKSKIIEFRDVQLQGNANYALRYWLNGYVNGSYYLQDQDAGASQRWDFNYSHDQNLTPDHTFRLSGSGSMMGDKNYHQNTSDSLEQIINKKLAANMTLSKSWPEKGISASVTGREDRDLITDRRDEDIPSMDFSFNERLLFNMPDKNKRDKKFQSNAENDTAYETEPKWYHSIYYGFGSNGRQHRTIDSGLVLTHQGASHRFTLRSPQNFLHYVTISPGFNYNESWFDSRIDSAIHLIDTTPAVSIDTAWGFYRRGNYELSLSANTNLYGIFPIPIGSFFGIRHTLTPSIGYSYRPKQSEGWHFRHVGMGDAGDNELQKSLNFSLSNLFQGKIKGNEKEKTQEKKFTLLNAGLGSSYNFAAKERKMSNLSVNASTNIFNRLNVNYSSNFDFYDRNLNFGVPRLLSQNIQTSTGFRLSGQWWNGEPVFTGPNKPANFSLSENWSLGVNHSYTYSYRKDDNGNVQTSENYGVDGNADIKFTKTWHAGYSAKYDLISGQLVNQSINFSKALHCWELVFNWTPTGPAKGYYFRVNVIEIPDVKVEKQDYETGRGYYYQ